MSDVQVRPFRRDDREQLTELVNAHIAAVVPGVSVSVQAVLAQLEREPNEFIVDRWVRERVTLVAVVRERVVAAAHVCRHGGGPDVPESYRDSGELRWLVCWPPDRHWPDSLDAGAEVLAAAVRWLAAAGARSVHGDGSMPAPGVYGIPQQWPHIATLLTDAGFAPGTRSESVWLAEVSALAQPVDATLRCARTVGAGGTCLSAWDGDTKVGYIEVELLGGTERLARSGGWADVSNLWVEPGYRRRGIGSWLVGHAAEWLRLGRVDRLLDYSSDEEAEYPVFLEALGFLRLTTTSRGWTRALDP